jgi:hypothetical protein
MITDRVDSIKDEKFASEHQWEYVDRETLRLNVHSDLLSCSSFDCSVKMTIMIERSLVSSTFSRSRSSLVCVIWRTTIDFSFSFLSSFSTSFRHISSFFLSCPFLLFFFFFFFFCTCTCICFLFLLFWQDISPHSFPTTILGQHNIGSVVLFFSFFFVFFFFSCYSSLPTSKRIIKQ